MIEKKTAVGSVAKELREHGEVQERCHSSL